ncbi:NfeD family protein [Chloroflexota bacterium]
MTGRLVIAIFSTALEEAAIAIVVLFGLPQMGITIPLGGLIALMAAWLALSVCLYQMGSRALKRKPYEILPHMVGCMGKVVSPLAPQGLVRIKGELWMATSAGEALGLGEKIIVIEQDSLKLVVRQDSS